MKTSLALGLSVLLVTGVVAANQLSAQTTATSPAPTVTTTGTVGTPTIPTVQNVVEITRAVPAGTTGVDAFTVPAGVTLVVTDILVTNTGTAAACGGAVNRTGGTAITPTATTSTGTSGTSTATGTTGTPTATPTTGATAPITTEGATGTSSTSTASATSVGGTTATTTSAATLTQTDSTVTGPLCVPAQTTTALPLITGIEFTSGQVVQLLNAPAAATTPGAAGTPGSLAFHLRGVLMTAI
jgi:collagen type VII alpha